MSDEMGTILSNMLEETAKEIAKKQNTTTVNETTITTSKNTSNANTDTIEDVEYVLNDNENTTTADEDTVNIIKNSATGGREKSIYTKCKHALQDLLAYIKSFRFNRQVNKEARELGIRPKFLKGTKLLAIMQGLADALHLGITITAKMVTNIVEFIKSIIASIINLTESVLRNIVDFVTLNSASMYN